MPTYIERETALSYPFANGQYDHKNANEHFIHGCESYKEYLEQLSTKDIVRCKDCAYWGNKVMLKDGTRGDCLNFFGYMTTTDFFCKWGEKRKESGQNT